MNTVKALTRCVFVTSVWFSSDALSESILEVPLNEQEWLKFCPAYRESEMRMHDSAPVSLRGKLADTAKVAPGGIALKNVGLPVPPVEGKIFLIGEHGADFVVSFTGADTMYSLVYESSARTYLPDFWSINGVAQDVKGYGVSDSRELTELIFGGAVAMDELWFLTVEASAESLACNREAVLSDLKIFLSLQGSIFDERASQTIVFDQNSLKGAAKIYSGPETTRVQLHIFDESRLYSVLYKLPSSDGAFLEMLYSAMGVTEISGY